MFRSTSRRVALATEGTQECLMFNVLSRLISIEISPPPWARKFFLVGAQISSLKLTLQRYDITIAVLECRRKKN